MQTPSTARALLLTDAERKPRTTPRSCYLSLCGFLKGGRVLLSCEDESNVCGFVQLTSLDLRLKRANVLVDRAIVARRRMHVPNCLLRMGP